MLFPAANIAAEPQQGARLGLLEGGGEIGKLALRGDDGAVQPLR